MSVRASFIALAVVMGTVFVVGCSQMGQSTSPTAPSSALTVPTSLAGGTSESLSQSSVFAPTARPTTSYDATGLWHLVIKVHGQVVDEVDTDLTQDADGNITYCGECESELFTLTRTNVMPGRLLYNVTYFGEGSPCNASGSGTAQLNTLTNTITGTITVQQDDCSRVPASMTLTRIP